MQELRFERRLLRWGNAYGIRVTKAEAEKLGVKEKQPIDVLVRPQTTGIDLSKIRFVKWGKDASKQHNQWVEEGVVGSH